MSNKKNKIDEEFKPNFIEPIEGQMRYDEILSAQKEENVEEIKTVQANVTGQIDMWSMTGDAVIFHFQVYFSFFFLVFCA